MQKQKDMEDIMLKSHRDFIAGLGKSISILEKDISEAGEMENSCTDEWCLAMATVRGARALGFGEGSGDGTADEPTEPEADVATERRAILDRLARHEIGADEAATAIRSLGRA